MWMCIRLIWRGESLAFLPAWALFVGAKTSFLVLYQMAREGALARQVCSSAFAEAVGLRRKLTFAPLFFPLLLPPRPPPQSTQRPRPRSWTLG